MITKAVQRYILSDSRWQVEKAAEEIGICLDPATGNPGLRGAYAFLKRWY